MVRNWIALSGMVAGLLASPVLAQHAENLGAPPAEADPEASELNMTFEQFGDQLRQLEGVKLDDLDPVKSLVASKRGGMVYGQIAVGPDGLVREFELTKPSGLPEVDSAIVDAIRGWVFSRPVDQEGKPVTVRAPLNLAVGYRPAKIHSSAYPVMPDEAKALGHNGAVRVQGWIEADGSVGRSSIAMSSNSSLLDAAMVANFEENRFEPPKGFDGGPTSMMATDKHHFTQADAGPAKGGIFYGLTVYTCQALIAESDWWLHAHPDKEIKDWYFSQMVSGLVFLGKLGGRGRLSDKLTDFRAHRRNFALALEACRAKPGETFLKMYRKQ